MLMNYHIGRLVLSSLCVGDLVRLVLSGVRFAGFSLQNEHHSKPAAPNRPLARSLGAATCIKKREDRLRRTTGDLHTPAARCTEVDGGILEHLLRTVTYLLFKHRIKIKIKLTIISLSYYY